MKGYCQPTLWILLFCLLSASGYGQKCLTSVKKTQALKNNPELVKQMQKQEEITQNWIVEHQFSSRKKKVEQIPVVVHVIWRESKENISDEQIKSQIDVLNEDFRKLNADFSKAPEAFKPLAADVEIEFCLASVDPNGQTTTGITRTKTSIDDIGLTRDFYYTADGGRDAWDVKSYLNIWVCDLGGDGLGGFATPPGYADPIESDGVTVAPQYFGRTGTAEDLGRTTTHEVGHYFNLEHPWGFDDGECEEGDFVDDTPDQEYESDGCPDFPLHDNCTPSGDGVMFNNYMDYSGDECINMFTKGQKARMLAALNNSRSSLLNSKGCSGSTTIKEAWIFEPSIFPNPAQNSLIINSSRTNYDEVYIILNSVGMKVLELNKNGQSTQTDISTLLNGVYVLTSSHPQVAPQKFIISK